MKVLRLILTFATLAGFLILNYGFANWSIYISKVSIPIGHLLSLAALLAAFIVAKDRKKALAEFLKEPFVIVWIGLAALLVIHLLFDLPKYGGYTARDASFVAEGAFLFLGFLWARNNDDKN